MPEWSRKFPKTAAAPISVHLPSIQTHHLSLLECVVFLVIIFLRGLKFVAGTSSENNNFVSLYTFLVMTGATNAGLICSCHFLKLNMVEFRVEILTV